jgi:hypothetical protein
VKDIVPLGSGAVGMAGKILAVRVEGAEHGLSAAELERRVALVGNPNSAKPRCSMR